MKKTIFFASIFLSISLNAWTQSGRVKVEKEPSEFAERLWYGGGFNLGFSSSGFGGFRISQFLLGVSPQVGYKLAEPFSVGPRASIQYANFSTNGDNASAVTWSAGVFSRYKLFWQIFAQLEYEYEDEAFVTLGNGLEVSRIQNNNVYIGGGYNSTLGPRSFGYEVLLLYNTTEDPVGFDSPIQFRFGFTYNF